MIRSFCAKLKTNLYKHASPEFTKTQSHQVHIRFVSSSPYGRTHIYKRRPPVLPAPLVPHFPQRVIRSDGSSFTHRTTSPRSLIRLTRDVTNNPIWNSAVWAEEGAVEEEGAMTGRLGRFNRRFESGQDMDWIELEGVGVGAVEESEKRQKESEKVKKKGKERK